MFTLSKTVANELNVFCQRERLNKSEFVESLIKTIVFNETGYAKFMLKQKKLEAAYWEYQARILEERDAIKRENLKAYV